MNRVVNGRCKAESAIGRIHAGYRQGRRVYVDIYSSDLASAKKFNSHAPEVQVDR